MRTTTRRFLLTVISVVSILMVPTTATAKQSIKQTYTDVRVAVVKKHERHNAGRNIRRFGVKTPHGSRPAKMKDYVKSIAIFRRMLPSYNRLLVPGPPSQPPAGIPSMRAPASGTLGSIAACESGGSPTAISSNGTYRGKYQFDYQTWGSVGGTGDPAAAPEAEQDRRAAMLYNKRGAAPWPVCGR